MAESRKCGRALKLQWNPPLLIDSTVNGYQVTLRSVNGELKRLSNLSREVRSHEFDGLEINTVYKLNIRARDLNGFGLWARQQLTTTAGKIDNKAIENILAKTYLSSEGKIWRNLILLKVSPIEIDIGIRYNQLMTHLQQKLCHV